MTVEHAASTEAPAAQATPAPDPTSTVDYHPSQDDAAMDAFLAERSKPEPETEPGTSVATRDEPTTSVPVAAAPAPPAADPDLDPADAKLARVLNRISRAEDERNQAVRERDTHAAEVEKLRARAAKADEYDRDFAEFQADPEKLFKRVGWKPETIQDYILNGPKAANPQMTALERKQAELDAQLKSIADERAASAKAQRINEYKATAIPQEIKGEADKLPFLHAFHDDPADRSNAIWGVIEQTYHSQRKELTPLEAAQQIEKILSSHFERLSRASSKVPPVSSSPAANSGKAPAAKPAPSPTLTNSPPTSPAPNLSLEEDDDTLLNRVAASLKAQRKAS